MRPNTQPFVAHDKAQQSSRLKRLLPSGLGDAFSPESGAGVRVLGERDSPLGTILDSKAEPQLFLRTADLCTHWHTSPLKLMKHPDLFSFEIDHLT